ncbi:hypothetical protein LSH36_534g01024 [Paralvinella palmiformis]|uniref:Uncharacterized protein n=1 Tax=Paralvinella palmiformis TaxID=53620 RepID=A0AAD9J7X2_9ANNE|nr:hypothetical protein LSH36_534g01024 [Paralvinella palmiformis]
MSRHSVALSYPHRTWSALDGNETSVRLTLEVQLPAADSSPRADSDKRTVARGGERLDEPVIDEEALRKYPRRHLLPTLNDAVLRKRKRADGLMVNLSLDVIRDMLSTQQNMKKVHELWMIGKK